MLKHPASLRNAHYAYEDLMWCSQHLTFKFLNDLIEKFKGIEDDLVSYAVIEYCRRNLKIIYLNKFIKETDKESELYWCAIEAISYVRRKRREKK